MGGSAKIEDNGALRLTDGVSNIVVARDRKNLYGSFFHHMIRVRYRTCKFLSSRNNTLHAVWGYFLDSDLI